MAGVYDLIEAASGKPLHDTRSKRRQKTQYLPPEQKSSMLASLAREAGGAVEGLGKALDTPGAIFRGVLAGKPTSGFSWDNDTRVSGRELLEQYGVIGKDANPYAATAAGFAAEVALDPLAMFFGPAKALGMGGKAVRAAGLLDKAGDAAMARIGLDAAAKSRTGQQATKFLRNVLPGKKALNPDNYKYRPLVGPRVAQTTATVRDVVERTGADAAEQASRIAAIENFLKPRGSSYAEVADDTLGGAFGVGYFTPMATFNPDSAIVRGALDRMDALGQAARWSAPARLFSQTFDQRVAGRFDAADQLYAMRNFDAVAAEKAAMRRLAATHVEKARSIPVTGPARQLLGADSLLSKEANDYLTRVFEGVQTNADEQLTNLLGRQKIEDLASSWRSISKMQVDEANALGINLKALNDHRYNVFYSPRTAAEANFGDYGKGMSRAAYSARTLENESRQQYLQTPGGTVDLREITLLPTVQKFIEDTHNGIKRDNIAEIGRVIKEYLDKKHGASAKGTPGFRSTPFDTYITRMDYQQLPANPMNPVKQQLPVLTKQLQPDEVITQQGAEKIASFMQRMAKDTPPGTPMFSRHPLASQAKNMVSQAVSRANARFVIDSIAEAAMKGRPQRMRYSQPFKRLDVAVDDIGRKIGATYAGGPNAGKTMPAFRQQIAESIAKQLGIPVDEVNLAKYSLPESVYNRLTAINDFYNSPRLQQQAVEFLNQYSQLFKGFVLAFPSRHVRDMYSNAFSVWLEVGDPATTNWGFSTAKKILAGRFDDAIDSLKEIPGYANIAINPDALRKKFVEDVAGSGVLETLASTDLLTANRAADLNQLVPGSTPVGKYDFVKEFVPGAGTFEKASDLLQFRGVRLPGQARKALETKNPLLTASQKFSDYTDSVARLGGFLAMMKKGATPSYAAERITEILVDYSSLTPIERNLFRSIFPWWAYNSRIGAAVAKQLIGQPGGMYAQTIRGMRVLQESDEDTYVPEALRQQFAVRVPDELKSYLGIPEGGNTTTFLKDIDIPGMDVISLLDPQPTLSGSITGTAQNLGNQANPLLRSAAETVTGVDMFSRRPLDQATTPLDRLYRSTFGTTQNLPPFLRTLINLTPGPRIAGIAGGLADDRIPMQQRVMKQAFNTLTGVKLQDADPEWMLQDARRKAGENLTGFLTDYTQSFIPEERLPEVPAELMPYYNLYRSLGRDLRDARQRDKQSPAISISR